MLRRIKAFWRHRTKTEPQADQALLLWMHPGKGLAQTISNTERDGYQVHLARSQDEALALLEEKRFHLVLIFGPKEDVRLVEQKARAKNPPFLRVFYDGPSAN